VVFGGFEVGPPLAGAVDFVLFDGAGVPVCAAVGVLDPEPERAVEDGFVVDGAQNGEAATELASGSSAPTAFAEAAVESAVPPDALALALVLAPALAVAEADAPSVGLVLGLVPPVGEVADGDPGVEHMGLLTAPAAAFAGSASTVP
jgi:hypothetical protein